MGLSNFPSAAEGVLPIIVMNTLISVAILKKLARAFLEFVGATTWVSTTTTTTTTTTTSSMSEPCGPIRRRRVRGVSIVRFNSSNYALDDEQTTTTTTTTRTTRTRTRRIECCVCLSKFEEGEEVSELSCKHFFHRKCLDKWFDNQHSTCPLCRSIH
ncbi:hypothetical protein vseg_002137 [Gypsophila vaccaria]